MDSIGNDILARASAYAQQYARRLTARLGFGKDGGVWTTNARTAIKVFAGAGPYARELAAYRRLAERDVFKVCGHFVPQVRRTDDHLLVIEMSIVKRPFVLDFASVHLDSAPDFGEEVMAEWLAEKQEQFGPHWPQAAAVLAGLRRHGVFLMDVHPGNIGFEETDPTKPS